MKKLFLSFLLIAAIGGAAIAQKTVNDANAQKRNVGSFHGIDVATGIRLVLTKGTTEEVAVSASKDEYRDKIITEVSGGVLKIHYETKTGSINKKYESKDLRAYVSYKELDKLHVTTGAEVEIDGVLQANTLDLKANTGGEVNGEVNIGTLKVDQNTGSKITLSGKADNLEIDGDTGSKFKGEDMKTSSCDVTVSTGAIVIVSAEKELQVRANTGGVVRYKGNASIKEIKKSTGGTVSKI